MTDSSDTDYDIKLEPYELNDLWIFEVGAFIWMSLESVFTVRRLYFATTVFALFLCEFLIKFYTQLQF